MSPAHRVLGIAAALLVTCAGCSLWNEPHGALPTLPPARMSADTVVMEVQFVRLPANGATITDDVWREIDEQCIALDVRRKLAQNGFRCGLTGARVPDAIRSLVEQQNALAETVPHPFGVGAQPGQSRRIHCRPGNRNRILTNRQRAHLVALYHQDGIVRGNGYDGAQCLLTMRCFPQGDGGVRIQLVPEIEHGPPRQRWIPGDGADWRLEADRERNVFGGLTLDATLAPGQSFVVTCMPEMDGSLGHSFFTDDYGGTTQQKLVLIRLAQSQLDVLFDTEQILASPEDNK